MRIVLVEDNESLAKGITYRLEDRGHAVDVLSDGIQAEGHLTTDGGDLIILDLNLPGMDGLTILKRMRDRGDERPVILLTARSDTEERVRGLDCGADDYLVKPFDMAELEARIRALARRKPREIRNTLSIGPVTLDLDARQVTVGCTPTAMPRREISALELLLSAQGRIVSKSSLLDHIYGVGADVEDSAVEVLISRLRKRLRPHKVLIGVQRGLGYSITLDEAP